MTSAVFTSLPDLASRSLGGTVMWTNDEFYALRDNLISPEPAVFDVTEYNHRGKVYDGWETRRRRTPGTDSVIIRLGTPGVVRGVVVDTANFTGNFPPFVSVEGLGLPDYPSIEVLRAAEWRTLLAKSPVKGDTANEFEIEDSLLTTHVKLTIHPDGGVARLRIHGDVVPDPRFLGGRVDVAAIEHGGSIHGCSNMFYSSPANVLVPGRPRVMAEGWETARRRDAGNDWLIVNLGAPSVLHHAIVDTSFFVGNAPGEVELSAFDATAHGPDAFAEPGGAFTNPGSWTTILARTPVQPDTRHRFRLLDGGVATHVRLDIFPDGGYRQAPSARRDR